MGRTNWGSEKSGGVFFSCLNTWWYWSGWAFINGFGFWVYLFGSICCTISFSSFSMFFVVIWEYQLMVWIPGIPLWNGLLLKGTLRIPNHRAPNQQLSISWLYLSKKQPLFAASKSTSFSSPFFFPPKQKTFNYHLPGDSSCDLFISYLEVTIRLWKGHVFPVLKKVTSRIARWRYLLFGCQPKNRGENPQNGWWK